MRLLATMARLFGIGALAAFAVYAAHTNAHDETSISAMAVRRAAIGWSVLPCLVLAVYLLNALLAGDSAKSFTPSIALVVVYSIVFGYCAWNGPSDASRSGYTHLIFVPMILGVFSLPFLVFMADRAVSMARERLRRKEPIDGDR